MRKEELSPEYLRKFCEERRAKPSAIAFVGETRRENVVEYLAGEKNALSDEVLARLAERLNDSPIQKTTDPETLNMVSAITKHLRNHSVHFLYEKSGEVKGASGTLVKIGGRYFVFTTRHTIPENTQFLELIGSNEGHIEVTKSGTRPRWRSEHAVKAIATKKHGEFDVGYIELDAETVPVLEREWIGLERIYVQAQPGRTTFVHGYPRDFIRGIRDSSKIDMSVQSFGYHDSLLDPLEWPEVAENSRPHNHLVDVFMHYSRTDEFKALVHDSGKVEYGLPGVEGMSGGGVWQSFRRVDEQGVWLPDAYGLIGIQTDWDPKRNYIRGIVIRPLLELLAVNYPDLKDPVSHHLKARD